MRGFRKPGGASWDPRRRREGGFGRVAAALSAVALLVAQVTYDGFSWAPVWSPDGDDLVYMHLSSTVVDLYMTHVNRSGTAFEFQMEPNLTEYSGLEGSSRAAWYMPAGVTASAS